MWRLVLFMLQVSVKLQQQYLKSVCACTHSHKNTEVTVQLILTYIPTWRICDKSHGDMCHTSLCDEAEESDKPCKGCTNGVEQWIKQRVVTTIKTSQQYHHCHTQFQALQCADSRQVQHTKIHQFTADRTVNTKCGNQYRLQFQAFYAMFRSRYSSGGADQLSTVLGTLYCGPSALPGVTEYELLLSRWL